MSLIAAEFCFEQFEALRRGDDVDVVGTAEADRIHNCFDESQWLSGPRIADIV